MNESNDISLEEALRAARELPPEEQRQIAEVLMVLVANQRESRMTPRQRQIVRERLNQPRQFADEEEVLAVLRRFDPTPRV